MKKINLIATFSLSLAIMISGCASEPKGPTLPKGNTLAQIYTLERLSGTMSSLDGKSYDPPSYWNEDKNEMVLEGELKVLDGYTESNATWCAWGNGFGENPTQRYKDSEQKLCTKKGGGAIGITGACTSRSDSRDIIFVLKSEIKHVDKLKCRYTIKATLIEATEKPLTSEFLGKARPMIADNQRPFQRIIEQSLRDKENREQQLARDIKRSRDSLPLMRKRGAMICKNEGRWSHVAYVEDFSDERIKVLIAKTYLTDAPNISPGGFKQEIHWVDPLDRWYPCGLQK